MLFSRSGKTRLIRTLISRKFGAGHAPYDWRADPKFNPYHTTDFSDVGLQKNQLSSPLVAQMVSDDAVFPPAGVDVSSPNVNFVPHRKKTPLLKILRAPDFDHEHDVDHEADHGSEDMDFQPECYKSQHFHKHGWIWPWIIAGIALPLYISFELIYQKLPDSKYFRKPHPMNLKHEDRSWDNNDQYMYENRERLNRFRIDAGGSEIRWKIED